MCVPQHITGESKKLEGIVEELLGADLMEHNILHKGIGVTETLETLARSAFGQMSYFLYFLFNALARVLFENLILRTLSGFMMLQPASSLLTPSGATFRSSIWIYLLFSFC